MAFICLLIGACDGNFGSDRPDGEVTIEMTAADYHWTIRHAGLDELLHTGDDVIAARYLHVPAGRPVHVLLRSSDFVYTFLAPGIDVNQIAVPALEFDFRFEPDAVQEIPFASDEMCGFQHESLMGSIFVVPASDYTDWLDRNQTNESVLSITAIKGTS